MAESVSPNYLSAAMAAGADGYILKEDKTANVLHAIDSVLKGFVYMSPGGRRKDFTDTSGTGMSRNSKQQPGPGHITFWFK